MLLLGGLLLSSHVHAITLTPEQLNTYHTEGLLIVPNLFTEYEIIQLSASADRLRSEAQCLSVSQTGKIMHLGAQFVIDLTNSDNLQIHRIVWAGAAEPNLIRLARQKKLLTPVAQLLGTKELDHLTNQLHYKMPHDEVKSAWHQDVKNRRKMDPEWHDVNKNGSFVQVIIAIDPMHADNGGIYYVPQSHLRGDLFLDEITDPEELREIAQLDRAVAVQLNPGDVIFMHPYLIHGSEPNRSEIPRRVFVNGFAYPGANNQPYPGKGSAQRVILD